MNYIYKNVEEYNPNNKRTILIVFDVIIPDMISNKKFNPIVAELFIEGIKLNIPLVYFTILFFCAKKY